MTRSWVDVDLAAVAANVRTLAAAAAGAEVCAVVKADGYGHGAMEVARAALDAGATRLAVAQVAEGEALRGTGIGAPIWVLAEPAVDEWPAVVAAGLEAAVYSTAAIDAAAATAGPGGMAVHLKIDTGMHRVGARPDDVVDLARRIGKAPSLRLGSVWTHLATADATVTTADGTDLASVQLDRYDEALARLTDHGIEVPLRHVANSAATLAHPRSHHDVVRCGIALYGLAPSPSLAGRAPLRPALSWRTTVSHVKRLRAGDAVGYGQREALTAGATVATVPVGYADGSRRGLWRRGAMLIGGRRRPIVGVVSMDQTVVDCGDDRVAVGDEVVLIGRQGDEEITTDDLAGLLDTINYEITCGIGSRSVRRHHRA